MYIISLNGHFIMNGDKRKEFTKKEVAKLFLKCQLVIQFNAYKI